MADAISIQELIDARTDAKTLEEAVNGDAVTTVLSRLGETYPTLSNALNQIDSKLDSADTQIKQGITNLFENGGLPATPFATKALMTASALADGKYAQVTDDTTNNGLYLKTAGTWVRSAYDPLTQAKSYTDTAKADTLLKVQNVFATKALMTASTLPDGSNAQVNNDTTDVNNGFYKKINGVWQYLKSNTISSANSLKSGTDLIKDFIGAENIVSNYSRRFLTGSTVANLSFSTVTGGLQGGKTAIVAVKPNTKYFIRKSESTDVFRVAVFKNDVIDGRWVIKDEINTGHVEVTTSPNERLLAVSVSTTTLANDDIYIYEQGGANSFDKKGKNIASPATLTEKLGLNLRGDAYKFRLAEGLAGTFSLFANVQPNTTYTISKTPSNRFRIAELSEFVGDNSNTYASELRVVLDNDSGDINSHTFTTSATAFYIIVYLTSVADVPFVQLEKGSVQTKWVTHGFVEKPKESVFSTSETGNDSLVFSDINPSDTAAAKKLNDLFLANAGGAVYLKSGTYLIDETITLQSRTHIIGLGRVILKLAPLATLSSVNWRGINVDVLVKTDESSENIIIDNVSVIGEGVTNPNKLQWGMCIGGKNHTINNSDVHGINWIDSENEEVRAGGNGWGLVFYKASGCTVNGGRYENSGYENVGTDNATNITFNDIFCGKGWRTSFQVHRNSHNITLNNATIIQTASSAQQTHAAVTLHGAPDSLVTDVKFINCTIDAQVSEGQNKRCGAIQTVSSLEHQVTIQGCNITTNKYGISTGSDILGDVEGWIINGNRINAGRKAVSTRGVGAVITNNSIKAQEDVDLLGTVDGNIVANNAFVPTP